MVSRAKFNLNWYIFRPSGAKNQFNSFCQLHHLWWRHL